MKKLTATAIALGTTLFSFAPAHAASFSITNVLGTWDNVQGTSSFDGAGTNQVRWGIAGTLNGQSGFNFNGTTLSEEILSGSNFILGELTHLNFPVHNASSGVDFDLSMNVDGTSIAFDYNFLIEETTNTVGACADFQVSNTSCDDRITFSSSSDLTTFAKNGFSYSLELLGFSKTSDGLSPVSSFITEENKASSAFLVARIIENVEDEASVPEPTLTFALLSLGISASRICRRN